MLNVLYFSADKQKKFRTILQVVFICVIILLSPAYLLYRHVSAQGAQYSINLNEKYKLKGEKT